MCRSDQGRSVYLGAFSNRVGFWKWESPAKQHPKLMAILDHNEEIP